LSYNSLNKISSNEYPEKSVLIIGSGFMAKHYCLALKKLGVKEVTILARNENKVKTLSEEFNYKYISGEINSELKNIGLVDLVIISTSISSLIDITKYVIETGQKNILIEKPGSLYKQDLIDLGKNNVSIRIGYNRLAYPNFYKLKEILKQEEITSCKYYITEKINSINFNKDVSKIYTYWGISNSLHVVSMAHELIGIPKEIHAKQFGNLKWHPSGSIFIGNGVTEKNIPFSYHADWESAGRWGIEIMTKEHAYRLIPLEKLFVCKKGSFEWEEIPIEISHPDVKQGISEEIALMFNEDRKDELPSLKKGAEFIKIAETIFGYNKK
jgi:predicted dehydrogenase